MKVKSESEVAQSCPTLNDPMDRSLPGSSVPGIFQARVLEWGQSPKFMQILTMVSKQVMLSLAKSLLTASTALPSATF